MHPLFTELTQAPDDGGEAGDVTWNFEKWVLARDGQPVARFRSRTEPTDPQVVAAIGTELARSQAYPMCP